MDNKDKKIPLHVAVIMDGNGRWAKMRGLPRVKGHEEGAESVKAIMRAARANGVKYLTLFAFSSENWSRPKEEINALMDFLVKFLKNNEHELYENKVRLRMIGRINDLPENVRNELTRVIQNTASYDDYHLILALSYGGRNEIIDAVRKIAVCVKNGALKPEEIDGTTISSNLYLPDLPDPDLLIRTSGEMRISNFLLWQVSYTELYITPVLWPDFREKHFEEAIMEYSRRQRRFGNIE